MLTMRYGFNVVEWRNRDTPQIVTADTRLFYIENTFIS